VVLSAYRQLDTVNTLCTIESVNLTNLVLRKSPTLFLRKTSKYVFLRKSPKSFFRENLPKISLFTCTPVGVHTSTTIIIIVGS
jgi:hypothetical protein